MSDSPSLDVLALDIGGANLKASDGRAFCASRSFPLWKRPGDLPDAIERLLATTADARRWIVTMTGELADCYRTKREGVTAILDAVVVTAGRRARPPEVEVYLTDGSFVSIEDARGRHLAAAASNWHALASFVARRCGGARGLLIDVGSTTCDLIPFADGQVVAAGRTDDERLRSGELVYTGVVRTPLCAVVASLPTRQGPTPTARELFATTRDAYLLLDRLAEDPSDCETADGRPAVKPRAHERLARCVCADVESFTFDEAVLAAAAVQEAQQRDVVTAFGRVLDRFGRSPEVVVLSGQGEFLARDSWTRRNHDRASAARLRSLTEELGTAASQVAPAFALAQLASEARP